MPLWYEKIAAAATQEALLEAARDYLATLTPEQFCGAPAWMRQVRVKGLDDIAYWQRQLAEEYCDGGALRDAEAALVSQLLAFFTLVSQRRSQLAHAETSGARALFSDRSMPKLFKEPTPPA